MDCYNVGVVPSLPICLLHYRYMKRETSFLTNDLEMGLGLSRSKWTLAIEIEVCRSPCGEDGAQGLKISDFHVSMCKHFEQAFDTAHRKKTATTFIRRTVAHPEYLSHRT